MTELLVIGVSVKGGRGHVVLAARAHDPASAKHITIDFPLHGEPDGSYPDQEETIVKDAKAVLNEARAALEPGGEVGTGHRVSREIEGVSAP